MEQETGKCRMAARQHGSCDPTKRGKETISGVGIVGGRSVKETEKWREGNLGGTSSNDISRE